MAIYIQPKIFSEFRCDGSKCNSMCCKNWAIDIDEETYQKYLALKVPNMIWSDEFKKYLFKLKPNGDCPNLDDDGLCKIQKDHGESSLSITCRAYPRYSQTICDRFFTRSLTLTCPVAANLILRQKQPIEFVEVEDDKPLSINLKFTDISDDSIRELIDVRLKSIRILQNRKLSIDQRLLTLGFFLSQIGNVLVDPKVVHDNAKMLDELCASEKYLREELPKFCRAIKFDSEDFLRIMFNLLESMYGKETKRGINSKFLVFSRVHRSFSRKKTPSRFQKPHKNFSNSTRLAKRS